MSLAAHLYGKCSHAVGLVTLTRLSTTTLFGQEPRKRRSGDHCKWMKRGNNQGIVAREKKTVACNTVCVIKMASSNMS